MSREKAPPATNQKQRGRTHKNTEATRKLAKLRSVNKKNQTAPMAKGKLTLFKKKENPHKNKT